MYVEYVGVITLNQSIYQISRKALKLQKCPIWPYKYVVFKLKIINHILVAFNSKDHPTNVHSLPLFFQLVKVYPVAIPLILKHNCHKVRV